MTFWIIKSLDSKDKHCFASNAYIARQLDLSETAISISISKLIKFRYVDRVSFNGRRRVLKINDDYVKEYKYLVDDYNEKSDQPLNADFKNSLRQGLSDLKGDNNSILTIEEIESKDSIGSSDGRPDVEDKLFYKERTFSLQEQSEPPLKLNRRKPPPTHNSNKPLLLTYPLEHKLITEHWNKKSSLPKLSLKKPATKSFTRAMNHITKTLAKHKLDQILSAIDTYENVLSSDSYKIRAYCGHKVGLYEFFEFATSTKAHMTSGNLLNGTKSWFTECIKGKSYLDERYGRYIKDLNPDVTELVKKFIMDPEPWRSAPEWPEFYFEEFDQLLKYGFGVDEENICRLTTKKLLKFMDAYQIGKVDKPKIQTDSPNPTTWAKFVFRAISLDISLNGNGIVPKLSWLVSKKTFDERLPKFFKFHNAMDLDEPNLRINW